MAGVRTAASDLGIMPVEQDSGGDLTNVFNIMSGNLKDILDQF